MTASLDIDKQGGPSALFEALDAMNISVETIEHPPVFTVDEARSLRGRLRGGHCKTLFLKAKKGDVFLLPALEETPIDLKALGRNLGRGRLSFGRPERLWDMLGVRPGAVTPFALINDPDRAVTVLLDAALMDQDELNFHPLINTMTTRIATSDFLRFLDAMGHQRQVIDFAGLPAEEG